MTMIEPTPPSNKRGPYSKSTQTRQSVIDAAKQLVTWKDVYVITIRDVMEKAGLTRPLFYKYFDSLDDLFKVAAAQINDEVATHLSHRIDPQADPAYRSAALIYSYLRVGFEEPTLAWFIVRYGPRSHSLQAHMQGVIDLALHAGVAAGHFILRPEQFASASALIRGTAIMTLRARLTTDSPPDLEQHSVGLILRGLGLSSAESERLAQAAAESQSPLDSHR